MPLFTVMADYAGGTYISQLRARDVRAAILDWAEHLDVRSIAGMDMDAGSKAELLDQLRSGCEAGYAPVPLDYLTNVWGACALVLGRLFEVNIIQTQGRHTAKSKPSSRRRAK